MRHASRGQTRRQRTSAGEEALTRHVEIQRIHVDTVCDRVSAKPIELERLGVEVGLLRALKVEELGVGEHGQIILAEAVLVDILQVLGGGNRVQVGYVFRHIRSPSAAVCHLDCVAIERGRRRLCAAYRLWKAQAGGWLGWSLIFC